MINKYISFLTTTLMYLVRNIIILSSVFNTFLAFHLFSPLVLWYTCPNPPITALILPFLSFSVAPLPFYTLSLYFLIPNYNGFHTQEFILSNKRKSSLQNVQSWYITASWSQQKCRPFYCLAHCMWLPQGHPMANMTARVIHCLCNPSTGKEKEGTAFPRSPIQHWMWSRGQ